MNPDNFFAAHHPGEIQKKYIQFSVFMEHLLIVLELPRAASMEQVANRIRDIVVAANNT